MDGVVGLPREETQPRNEAPVLPGIAALRAFVLTLEHASFSRAAEVLGVTHAAVIQQVRGLESRLGSVLIERDGRQLKGTARGTELFLRVRDPVRALEDVFVPLPADGGHRPLRINTTPCFAAGWLLPRLARLRERFPCLDFIVDTDISVVDLTASRADLAFRYGLGRWAGLRARWLVGETAVPVAVPRIAGDGGHLSPEAVLSLPLIENPLFSWRAYAAEHGLRPPRRYALVIRDSWAAQQAAEAGLGVALARGTLIAQKPSRLGCVAAPVSVEGAWWLCVANNKQRDRQVEALADAILRMAGGVQLPAGESALAAAP